VVIKVVIKVSCSWAGWWTGGGIGSPIDCDDANVNGGVCAVVLVNASR
jgi:hypothetical protein